MRKAPKNFPYWGLRVGLGPGWFRLWEWEPTCQCNSNRGRGRGVELQSKIQKGALPCQHHHVPHHQMTYQWDFTNKCYFSIHLFALIPSFPFSRKRQWSNQFFFFSLHYFHHWWLISPYRGSPSLTNSRAVITPRSLWGLGGCHQLHHSLRWAVFSNFV